MLKSTVRIYDNYKLHALKRIRKYLALEAKLPSNAFIDSYFNYAPLIWMFCQKTLYVKIEKIYRKTLRISQESDVSYCDLPECIGSTSIHQ